MKAAARRDALVRWARDAWRAATASNTPGHSVSSLEKLVKAAGEARGERERDLGPATSETATSETATSETATFETATSEPERALRAPEAETILFVVDVSAPQVNFEGVDGTGRVLVAATEGRVVGRRVRSTAPEDVFRNGGSRREVKVTLRRAQAHVAPTDVDVYAGVQWLDASAIRDAAENGAGVAHDAPSGGGYLLRRVFEPCSMDLAFVTKEPVTRVSETTPSGASKDFQGLPRTRPPEALTEFALESPEIEAELTAEQFAALVDVVGSVFLAQYPTDATPPPVAAARLLANTNRSLVDAEDRASAAVVAAPLAEYKEATWRLNERLVDDQLLATSSTFKRESSKSFRLRESCLLALRSAARDAETAVSEAVFEAEALVRPHRRRPAVALRLEIARFRWAMRSGGRSFLVARVDAMRLARERHSDTSGVTRLSLGDLKLDVPAPASAGRKHAGGTTDEKRREKIIFTKPVFARWDPDAPEDERGAGGFSASRSFDGKSADKSAVDTTDTMNDRSPTNEPPCYHPSYVEGRRNPKPLVSVEAKRAASPPEAPVWDQIEVSVEPFDLHLESETYGVLVRYLFPEKKRSGVRATERNSRASKSRSSAGDENELARVSKRDLDDWSSSETTRGASASASASATAEAEEKARVMLLGHGPRVGKHARAKTWGADLFGGGGGGVPAAEPKQFSTPTKPRRGRALTAPEGTHKRKHTLVTRDPVASTLAERAPRPFPLTVDDADAERDEKHHSRSSTTRAAESRESSRAMANGVIRGDARGDGRERDAAILPANAYSPKVVVVHHLKVNDVALRVSYDGPPKKFHEVRLLLDASTHAAFVGRWRELIDRVKKKIVWSVLKSVTGLQGRRLPGAAGSAGTGSAGTGSAVAAGEASARRGFGAFGNMAKGIKVRFGDGGGDALQATLGGSDGNILRVPEGFEGFEGDLDFAEGLTALGSPTAAAMVAESDGLVVPAGRANAAGASVWARVFGGARGV